MFLYFSISQFTRWIGWSTSPSIDQFPWFFFLQCRFGKSGRLFPFCCYLTSFWHSNIHFQAFFCFLQYIHIPSSHHTPCEVWAWLFGSTIFLFLRTFWWLPHYFLQTVCFPKLTVSIGPKSVFWKWFYLRELRLTRRSHSLSGPLRYLHISWTPSNLKWKINLLLRQILY